jgi:hypothetical protein
MPKEQTMKKKHGVFWGFAVLLMTAIFTLFGCTNPAGGGGNRGGNSTFLETLGSLGVITDLGRQKDPNGNDLYNGYNPLGVKGVRVNAELDDGAGSGTGGGRGALYKQAEIYIVNGDTVALYEDLAGGSLSALGSEAGAASWAGGSIKKLAFANDFDGDGRDEVMIVALNPDTNTVSLRYMDFEDGINSREAATWTYEGEDPLNACDMGISSGDLDGDGKDELIVTIFDKVYIRGDVDENFRELENFSVGSGNIFTFAACADYDQDGYDEWILVSGEYTQSGTGTYTIYDDLAHGGRNSVIKTGALPDGVVYATVAAGDFDGDGIPDTAFSGYNGGYCTFVLKTSMDSSSKPVFAMSSTLSVADAGIWGVATGDMDMDGKDEIVALGDVLRWNSSGLISIGTWTSRPTRTTGVDIADVTGDKRADFVFQDGSNLGVVSMNSSSSITTNRISFSGGNECSALCLPNVDNDSYVLEFAGHELQFTNPVVQAVIASPPYYAASGNENGGTTLGWSSSSGTGGSRSEGFKVGVSVGASFKAGFIVIAAETTIKATVENSFTWGSAWSKEVTETWQYDTGVGEDKVVYTAIPFDVYYYTVISAPSDAIAEGETLAPGDTMVVSVPRKPGTYNASLAHFNAHNGDGYDITTTALRHTLGIPSSYYSQSQVAGLKSATGNRGLFTKEASELRTGYSNTGSTSRSVEEYSSEEKSFSYDLEAGVEAEVVASGVLVGASAKYAYGYSTTTTVGNSIFIQGQVPDLSVSSLTAFNWGLLMFPVEEQGQAYNVVTYWVEE